ncbi:MAG: PQQ-binding-like beta-propeller repeat protein [Bacteroidetes bacterium]|nr:PQQ-binding-like beta-propeller repeat protein [Bacteroidota bacterium]
MKSIQTLILSLIVLSFTSCGSSQKDSAESLQWRGPNRDGIFNEKNLLDEWPEQGPELLWKYEQLGAGHSSVAFGGEKVFTLGTNLEDSLTSLFAFSKSGELLWKKELGKEWMTTWPAERSTPLILDGKGYVFDGLGVMYCFSIEDGTLIWQRKLIDELAGRNSQHGVHENLIIDGNRLFCTIGGEESNIIALDKETGETLWVSKGTGEMNAYCSPTIIEHFGKKYYITMTFNALVSVDIENGEVAWKQELTEPKYGIHASVPLYHDGLLFIIEGYRDGSRMFKIADDGLSAEMIWRHDSIGPQMGDAVRIGNDLYVSSSPKRKWFCIDWYTGKVKFSSDKLSEGTVIAADNKLFILTYKGVVAMVKVEVKIEIEIEICSLEVVQIAGEYAIYIYSRYANPYLRRSKVCYCIWTSES